MTDDISNLSTKVNYFSLVQAHCQDQRLSLTVDRRLWADGQQIDGREVFNDLLLATSQGEASVGLQVLKAAWEKWQDQEWRRARATLLEQIAYKPDAKGEGWDDLIFTLLVAAPDLTEDQQATRHKLAKAVLMGAIHRVKAKLLGQEPTQHIMAYLYGRQGSGKTSFMKWFLGPVETGMVVTDFSIFGHDETKSLLRTTPVIFFDEMEKADKADLARVKNMMTSSTAVFRRIFGAATKAPIMSTFFGAGDRDLSQVLNDPAGLRRFFQIEVKPDLFEHLGELFERINPVDLWRAVDENGPCPIETGEIVALLRETTRRSPTPVTEWIAEKVEEGGWAEFRDEKNLFREFSQWKRAYFPGDRTNLFKFRADLERISKSGVFSMDGRSTQTGHMEYNIETTASDNVATSFETDEFRPIRGQKPKRVVIEYW